MRQAAQAHARACSALGLPELAAALCLLNAEATDALPELLDAVCAPFCRAFFPRRVLSLALSGSSLHSWTKALFPCRSLIPPYKVHFA